MSEEQGGLTSPEESSSGGMASIMNRLSEPGELLVAAGAIVSMVVYLLGDLIGDDYSTSGIAWTVAALVIANVIVYRWGGRSLLGAYAGSMLVLGFLGGLLVARELVEDIRFDYLDRGGVRVLWAVIYYVSGTLMLVGAWQLWSRDEGSS